MHLVKECVLLIVCISFHFVDTKKKPGFELRATLERCTTLYQDKDYGIIHFAQVARVNRTSPYMLNFNATVGPRSWTQNVTFILKSYEFRNNQYRESFVSFKLDVCSLLENDWLTSDSRKYGNVPKKCPLIGPVYMKDMVFTESTILMGWPQGRWKYTQEFVITNTSKTIISGEICFNVLLRSTKRN